MKQLVEYLLSKNHSKAISYDIKDYCLLVMWEINNEELENDIEQKFKDFKFPNNANSMAPDYWLVPIDIAKEYKESDGKGGITLYQIPNFCHNIEDVKSALKDGRLDINELEQIDEFK